MGKWVAAARRASVVVMGVAAIVAGPAAGGEGTTRPAATSTVRAEETVLYSIPDGVQVADTVASPDARHVACVESRPKDAGAVEGTRAARERVYTVAVDGRRGSVYEWVVGRSLTFSPDGSRYAFEVSHDGRIFVVAGPTDGSAPAQEGLGFFMVARVTFSPDGKRLAYRVRPERVGASVMVVDGRSGEAFDPAPDLAKEADDDAESIFSKDGRRFAFRAWHGGKQLFVIDGTPGTPYDEVRKLVFSTDGNHYGYLVRNREGGADRFFVVFDGKEQPRYDLVAGLVMAPDGRRFAYAAQRAGKQMLVVNDKAYKPYDGLGDIAMSPDGRRLAVSALSGKQWVPIVDGKEAAPLDGIGRFIYSADGRHIAYAASHGKKQAVVVDGREGPAFDVVGTLTFSPDGARLAYGAADAALGDGRFLVVDDKVLGPAGLFSFSPDGRHVAHAVPLSGQPGAGEKWGLSIDGAAAVRADKAGGQDVPAAYEGFPLGNRLIWDGPAGARAIGGRGKDLLRVELRLTP